MLTVPFPVLKDKTPHDRAITALTNEWYQRETSDPERDRIDDILVTVEAPNRARKDDALAHKEPVDVYTLAIY